MFTPTQRPAGARRGTTCAPPTPSPPPSQPGHRGAQPCGCSVPPARRPPALNDSETPLRAPGWLSGSSISLWLRSRSRGPGIESCIRLPAQGGARFSLPLCDLTLALSLKNNKRKEGTPLRLSAPRSSSPELPHPGPGAPRPPSLRPPRRYLTLFLLLFFLNFYLFMIVIERERGRDTGRGRGRLHAPGARRGIRSRVSRIAPCCATQGSRYLTLK